MSDIRSLRSRKDYVHGLDSVQVGTVLGQGSLLPQLLTPPTGNFGILEHADDLIYLGDAIEDNHGLLTHDNHALGHVLAHDAAVSEDNNHLSRMGLTASTGDQPSALPCLLFHETFDYVENIHEMSESFDIRGVGPLKDRWTLVRISGSPALAFEAIILLFITMQKRFPGKVPNAKNIWEHFSTDSVPLHGIQRILVEIKGWGTLYETHQRLTPRGGHSWIARCLSGPGLRLLYLFFYCPHTLPVNTPSEGSLGTSCWWCSKVALIADCGFVETAIFLRHVREDLQRSVIRCILPSVTRSFERCCRWIKTHLSICSHTSLDGQDMKYDQWVTGSDGHDTHPIKDCYESHSRFVSHIDGCLLQHLRCVVADHVGLTQELLLSQTISLPEEETNYDANMEEM